jgi:hypothetical protein
LLGAGERRGRTGSLESSAWESTRTNRGEAEDRVDYATRSVGQIADSNPAIGTIFPSPFDRAIRKMNHGYSAILPSLKAFLIVKRMYGKKFIESRLMLDNDKPFFLIRYHYG